MKIVGREMVHIIPWSLDVARILFVLRKHGVARVHLLNPVEEEKNKFTQDHKKQGEVIQRKIKSSYRGVPIVPHDVCCYHFEDLVLHIFEIIAKEKARESYVIPHVFAGSTVYRLALYIASCLNRLNVSYVRAKDYRLAKGKMVTSGVDEPTYIVLPYFQVTLPKDNRGVMLRLLLETLKTKTPTGKPQIVELRQNLATGFQTLLTNDGLQPTHQTAEVYMSNTIKELVDAQYLEDEYKMGRKYRLAFTDQGLLMAKIVSLKREVEKGKDLSSCNCCGGKSMLERQ
jgi:hypothetical protein